MYKEIEVLEPFNTIFKTFPNGEMTAKKFNFTCWKVKKGYEIVTDEEKQSFKKPITDTKHKTLNNQKELDFIEPLEDVYKTNKQKEERKTEVEERRKERKVLYNISKTKTKIYDIACSNDFNYFITLTYSSEKCDRYSFEQCSKKVRKFMNNFKNMHADTCPNFKYLLIHEKHQDGAYHYHGLIYLDDDSTLKHDHVRTNKSKNTTVYNWQSWKNGFSTVSKIENIEATRKYILKYISKSILEDYTKGQRRFYYSQNCLKPKVETRMATDTLNLYQETYRTERSTGYKTTEKEFNEMLDMVIEFQYGINTKYE